MNAFRVLGDLAHILSFVLLLWKMAKSKSVAGISLKTQQLYLVVFVTRYVDLAWNFTSLYNWCLKVLFIGSSAGVVGVMMKSKAHVSTYNADLDAFPYLYLVVPCAVLGVLINQDHWSLFEMMWAFSVYLEAVAIMPQLAMLQRQGEVENLTSHYVAALGAYRGFYLLNWMYRYFTEAHYVQRIVWFAGTVQTLLYCDFFYHYYQSKRQGLSKPVKLPI